MSAEPGFAHPPWRRSRRRREWPGSSPPGDGEVAQESDEIGGALFSHFWTTGLRGAADADGDRRRVHSPGVFRLRSTLRRCCARRARARSSSAPQERLDLTVAGPVVLTELAAQRATLVLPADRDALYLVYGVASRYSSSAELFACPPRSPHRPGAPGRALPGPAPVRGGRRRRGGSCCRREPCGDWSRRPSVPSNRRRFQRSRASWWCALEPHVE